MPNENESTAGLADYSYLGELCNASFESDSDIISIKVTQDLEVDCTAAQVDSPSWETIWGELHKRVVKKRGKIPVTAMKIGYSPDENQGYIEKIGYSFKHEDKILFRNAIVVKSSRPETGPFLRCGDSGALISFVDSSNKEQAFGYAVCEVDGSAGNESSFICFKLNTGLKKLNLATEAGCFKTCGSEQ
jgi:hypothetical protein